MKLVHKQILGMVFAIALVLVCVPGMSSSVSAAPLGASIINLDTRNTSPDNAWSWSGDNLTISSAGEYALDGTLGTHYDVTMNITENISLRTLHTLHLKSNRQVAAILINPDKTLTITAGNLIATTDAGMHDGIRGNVVINGGSLTGIGNYCGILGNVTVNRGRFRGSGSIGILGNVTFDGPEGEVSVKSVMTHELPVSAINTNFNDYYWSVINGDVDDVYLADTTVSIPANGIGFTSILLTQHIHVYVPLTKPGDLSAYHVGKGSVGITWGFNSGGEEYRIYRDDVPVATVTGLFYMDTGLRPASTYTYTVEATRNGDVSPRSDPLSVTTLAPEHGNVSPGYAGGSSSDDTPKPQQRTLQWVDVGEDGYTFTVDVPNLTKMALMRVTVDGEETSLYTARNGSVIVTLKRELTDNLSPGKHRLLLEFLNHYGEADFTVNRDRVAEDSDYSSAGKYQCESQHRA